MALGRVLNDGSVFRKLDAELLEFLIDKIEVGRKRADGR
jgi:hypothetical protein